MSAMVTCFTCSRNDRQEMCSFTLLESQLFKFVFKHEHWSKLCYSDKYKLISSIRYICNIECCKFTSCSEFSQHTNLSVQHCLGTQSLFDEQHFSWSWLQPDKTSHSYNAQRTNVPLL